MRAGWWGRDTAGKNLADKTLLSVIKICISLYHNGFYTKGMSGATKGRLLEKLNKRKGPVVQVRMCKVQ
eukprot:13095549-Ditylum_brightwellii.AAC.1